MQTHTIQARDLAAALKSLQAATLKTRTASTVTVTLDHVMTLRGLCPGSRVVPSTRIGGGAALEAAVGLAPLLKIAETLIGAVELSVIPGAHAPDDLLIRQNTYTAQLYGGELHAAIKATPVTPVPAYALSVDARVLGAALAIVCPAGFTAGVWLDRVSASELRLSATDTRRMISTVVACVAPSALSVCVPEYHVRALIKSASSGGNVGVWTDSESLYLARGGEVECVHPVPESRPHFENLFKYWPGRLFASGVSVSELRRAAKLVAGGGTFDPFRFRAATDGAGVAVEGRASTVQLDGGQLADSPGESVPVDARLLVPMLSKLDRVDVGFSPSMMTINAGDGVIRLLAAVRE